MALVLKNEMRCFENGPFEAGRTFYWINKATCPITLGWCTVALKKLLIVSLKNYNIINQMFTHKIMTVLDKGNGRLYKEWNRTTIIVSNT